MMQSKEIFSKLDEDTLKLYEKAYNLTVDLGHEFVKIEHLVYMILTKAGFSEEESNRMSGLGEILEFRGKEDQVKIDPVLNKFITNLITIVKENKVTEVDLIGALLTITSEPELRSVFESILPEDNNSNFEKNKPKKACENQPDYKEVLIHYPTQDALIYPDLYQDYITQMVEVLNMAEFNSVILKGEAGVGKGWIIQSLALSMTHSVAEIKLPQVLAASQSPGDCSTRLINAIEGSIKEGINVLVISDADFFLDPSNYLFSTVQQVVFAYLRYYSNVVRFIFKTSQDPDSFLRENLKKYLNVIEVEPMEEAKTAELITRIANDTGMVTIDDEIIKNAVSLSRYIKDKGELPGKAISVLNRSISKAFLKNDVPDVEIENVKQAVSEMTGLPVEDISLDDSKETMHLNAEVKKFVIGQDKAVDSVSNIIKRSRLGIIDNKTRPIGSFLFVGPTGVGKTYLAQILSNTLYKREPIKIDMSEYMEQHSVSKMIGSPPGYVGYGRPSKLAVELRKSPSSVILFDEIEKAHDDVFNIFLQMLEDGKVTLGNGKTLDFSKSIIIMTSNVGTDIEAKEFEMVGFRKQDTSGEVKDAVMERIKKTFRPEFIGRLDDIVQFNELEDDQYRKIVENMMNELGTEEFREKFSISYTPKFVDAIMENALDKSKGARSLRNFIRSDVASAIEEAIIDYEGTKGEIRLTTDAHGNIHSRITESK